MNTEVTKGKDTGLIETMALDGGNAWLKTARSNDQYVHSFPSVLLKIDPDVDEVNAPNNGKSFLIEWGEETWVAGELAEAMGGTATYLMGKPEHMHILYMAAISQLTSVSAAVIQKLNILVPDGRKKQLIAHWEAVAEKIKSLGQFKVNGKVFNPQVREFNFISEGLPAYHWAQSENLFSQWTAPGITKQAVLDIGGGETTFQVFSTQTGQVIWGNNLTLPGVKALAEGIATKLKPLTQFTPDSMAILRALHLGIRTYQIQGQSIDFTQQYEAVRKDWTRLILQQIKSSGILTGELGGVLIIGGGWIHSKGFEKASSGRFLAPKTDLDLQHVNAVALTEI